MINIRLGEEFREPLNKIKGFFPNSSYTRIVTNIVSSYLPIYEQGMISLHNPQLTIGRADAGAGLTTSTKPPVSFYSGVEEATKAESEAKKSLLHHQENSSEKDEIPEELENLFD